MGVLPLEIYTHFGACMYTHLAVYPPVPEAQFPRIIIAGNPVSEKNPARQDTETWPCPSALMMVYLSDPEAKISPLLARGLLRRR
jgi:hypothetical protein